MSTTWRDLLHEERLWQAYCARDFGLASPLGPGTDQQLPSYRCAQEGTGSHLPSKQLG